MVVFFLEISEFNWGHFVFSLRLLVLFVWRRRSAFFNLLWCLVRFLDGCMVVSIVVLWLCLRVRTECFCIVICFIVSLLTCFRVIFPFPILLIVQMYNPFAYEWNDTSWFGCKQGILFRRMERGSRGLWNGLVSFSTMGLVVGELQQVGSTLSLLATKIWSIVHLLNPWYWSLICMYD